MYIQKMNWDKIWNLTDNSNSDNQNTIKKKFSWWELISILQESDNLKKEAEKIIEEFTQKLKEFILSKINSTSPFTKGKEGEIYKIHISLYNITRNILSSIKSRLGEDIYQQNKKNIKKILQDKVFPELHSIYNKDIIVTKKRFDGNIWHELEIHRKAFETVTHSENTAHIPQVFPELCTKDSLVMEYIPGKTLYCMILEKIILYYSQLKSKWFDQNAFLEIFPDTIKSKDEKWYTFSFSDDTQAEKYFSKAIRYILTETQYKGDRLFFENTNQIEKIIMQEYEHLLKNQKVQIFDKETLKILEEKIKNTLTLLHDNNIYHRDLWENPRNIMFTKADNTYEPRIIDFWVSVIDKSNNNPYEGISTADWIPTAYAKDEKIIGILKQILIQEKSITTDQNQLKLIDLCKENSEFQTLCKTYDISESMQYSHYSDALKEYFSGKRKWIVKYVLGSIIHLSKNNGIQKTLSHTPEDFVKREVIGRKNQWTEFNKIKQKNPERENQAKLLIKTIKEFIKELEKITSSQSQLPDSNTE